MSALVKYRVHEVAKQGHHRDTYQVRHNPEKSYAGA